MDLALRFSVLCVFFSIGCIFLSHQKSFFLHALPKSTQQAIKKENIRGLEQFFKKSKNTSLEKEGLVYALEQNKEKSVNFFLADQNFNASFLNSENQSALYFAVLHENKEWTDKILKKNPPINAADSLGLSPLSIALLLNSRQEIALALLKDPLIDPNHLDFNFDSYASLAAFKNKNAFLSDLLKHLQFDKTLLKRSNQQNLTPFHLALLKNNLSALELFSKEFPPEEIRNETAENLLMFGLKNSLSNPILDFLLKIPVLLKEKDEKGRNALFFVQTPAQLEKLIAQGIDINSSSQEQETPLMQAIRTSRENLALFLLDLDINLASANTEKKNALHLIIEQKNLPLLKKFFLKKESTDPKTLLDFQSALNSQTEQGYTPLMTSILSHFYPAFVLLRENNVNLDLKTPAGENALELAEKLQVDFFERFEKQIQEKSEKKPSLESA